MKQIYILLIILPLLCHTYPSEDSNQSDDSELAESDPQITKRSGSIDLVTHIKSGLLASISKASASIASGSSGGSSGYKSIDNEHTNSVEFDPWSLKKSVLNTIFQAVKAITGGVTALKGQLIKGSGYVLSAGGKLVAASGDKVTDVGKNIINSAQLSPTPPQGHGQSSHPLFKLSSLSGGSSGGGHGQGPVVHSETITTYEIPPGHHNYGPPSKPPSFGGGTHQQYLPPQSYSGGAPFSNHASFEAPSNNYLPSKYGPSYEDGGGQHSDAFNIYGRHTKLSEKEVRKAAESLQEILQLLPAKNKHKEITKTSVTIEKGQHDGYTYSDPPNDFNQYDIPPLRQLESVSHVETITAAYGPPLPHKIHSNIENKNPSDIYRQMAHRNKDTASPSSNQAEGYSYPNPHHDNTIQSSYPPSSSSRGGVLKNIVKSTSYKVNIDPYRSSPPTSLGPSHSHQSKAQQYTYFNPVENRIDTQFERRRDSRQNLRKFEYLRNSQIRNADMFNRNMLM
ncbi:uncharacterized protein LOC129953744 isoform X2 [Eupeodes corollae]|uniref:uncharacterized protein LOC129953744 isoform X2 n=1 Tax=Eupeodes corollae TaxID=290404 RepID=UPI0024905FF5|nr:uncharacterized protein LOC129953744 isoform X2 [Eupeodes corollae]